MIDTTTFAVNTSAGDSSMTQLNTVLPDNAQVGNQLGGNLCLLQVVVRAPDGRIVIDQCDIHARDVDGVDEVIDKKKITRSRWKIDQHPLWGKLSENKRDITHLLSRFSVSDLTPGQFLVSMLKVGELLGELTKIREKRKSLARLMADVWYTEIVPGIREFVGEKQFYQVQARLPKPEALVDRFDVEYTVYPITPMRSGDIDVTALNGADAQMVIDQVEDRARELMLNRFDAVAQAILTETLTMCDQITNGSLESGKRKSGAIVDIITILERVQNFKEFASPEVLAQVKVASDSLSGLDITDINGKTDVQNAIRKAFAPLGIAIEDLQNKRNRLRRSLDV